MNDRGYEVARNYEYHGHQRAFASMVYNFLDKKRGSGAIGTIKAGVSFNEQLAKELP